MRHLICRWRGHQPVELRNPSYGSIRYGATRWICSRCLTYLHFDSKTKI